ncbi:MAG: hypothetical protein KBT19_08385 [Lachnospiraceae bacterium]|nr:hypothetical protein [Candidatus Colinaster equi]
MVSSDEFIEIEYKYGLNKKEQRGINYWTYIRFELWNNAIYSELLDYKKIKESFGLKLTKELQRINNFFRYSMKGKQHDMLVLCHPRRVFEGDLYKCIYTDDVVNNYYDALFLSESYRGKHYSPIMSQEITYNDRVVIGANLFYKFFCLIKRKETSTIRKAIINDIASPIKEINEKYHTNLSVSDIAQKALKLVIRCTYEKRKYEKLILQVKPKLILEVVHYDRKCMLINEIAKERAIPIIELQHGTIYEGHMAYQYDRREKILQLPNVILLFSDFWKKSINLPLDATELISTGSTNFESKVNTYRKKCNRDSRCTVLFISQATIGEQLSTLALNLEQVVDESEVRIIYKLHPAEYSIWKENYPYLLRSNIEVIDSNRIDLYECFAVSDFQVGVYSTAIYEGVGFGLDTMILAVGQYEAMQMLVDEGYATLIDSVNDIVNFINKKNISTDRISHSKLWECNSLENIRNEIDNVLNGKIVESRERSDS